MAAMEPPQLVAVGDGWMKRRRFKEPVADTWLSGSPCLRSSPVAVNAILFYGGAIFRIIRAPRGPTGMKRTVGVNISCPFDDPSSS